MRFCRPQVDRGGGSPDRCRAGPVPPILAQQWAFVWLSPGRVQLSRNLGRDPRLMARHTPRLPSGWYASGPPPALCPRRRRAVTTRMTAGNPRSHHPSQRCLGADARPNGVRVLPRHGGGHRRGGGLGAVLRGPVQQRLDPTVHAHACAGSLSYRCLDAGQGKE